MQNIQDLVKTAGSGNKATADQRGRKWIEYLKKLFVSP